MASVRDVLLRISGDGSGAERALQNVGAELEALGAEDAKASVDIQDGAALAAIAGIRDDLEQIDRITASPRVTAHTAEARAELDVVQEQLDSLGHTHATPSVDLDGVTKALAEIEILKRELAGLQRSGGGGLFGGGGTRGGLSFGGSGGSIFAQPSLIKAGIASAAVIGPTVGTSLVQGALGAGALGAAAGGAAAVGGGGILSIAIGGVSRLSKALTAATTDEQNAGAAAIQRAQQELSASAASQAAAEQVQTSETTLARTRVAASQAVAAAEETLANAEQQENYAQQALTAARKDATRQIEDYHRAAVSATDQAAEARINLAEAERALREAPATSTALDIRQLEENVTTARHALIDAQIQRKRAAEDDAKAQRKGVHGDPGVVSARRARDQAQQQADDARKNLARTRVAGDQQIADATRAVADAQRAQAQAAEAARLQTEALAQSTNTWGKMLSQLPASGQRAARMIQGLRDDWKSATSEGANAFFGAIDDGVNFVRDHLGLLAGSANASMGAARDAVDQFLNRLDGPTFRDFVQTMTVTFVRALPILTRAFGNIGATLSRIAIAAAPELIRMLKRFADDTDVWLKHSRNAGKLSDTIHRYVGEFRAWLGLIGAVGHLLAALFLNNQRNAHDGKRAIEGVTASLNEWADWLNNHKGKVHAFFGGVINVVNRVIDTIGTLGSSFLPVLEVVGEAIGPVSSAIHTIVTALNSLKVGNVSALTVLLGVMAARSLGGRLGVPLPIPGGGSGIGSIASKAGTATTLGGLSVLGRRAIASRFGVTLPGIGEAAGSGIRGASALGGPGKFLGPFGAVAFQSLFGKPGSFLGPGIAGRTIDPGSFPQDEHTLAKIRGQLANLVRRGALGQLNKLMETAQESLNKSIEAPDGTGRRNLKRQALATLSAVTDAVKQTKADIRAQHLGGEFANTVAEGRSAVKDQLDHVGKLFDHMTQGQQDSYIKAAKQQLDFLNKIGLVSDKAERKGLADLEDSQQASLKRQRVKFQNFQSGATAIIGNTFGGMVTLADSALGEKGVAGIVNKLLVGVDSTKKLKWNVTTAGAVLGNLVSGLGGLFSGGAARGGRLPGYSTVDNMLVPMRGGERVLRPEDHVPAIDGWMRRGGGPGLDAFLKATGGSGYDKGGKVAGGGPAPPSTVTASGVFAGMHPAAIALAEYMLKIFGGSIGSGYRTPAEDAAVGGSGHGEHTLGIAFDISPADWTGASRYANQIGPQLSQGIHQAPPGVNVSWSGGAQVDPSYWGPSTWADHVDHIHLSTYNAIKGVGKAVAGAVTGAVEQVRRIPELILHGPGGSFKDAGQGMLDMGRHAANDYIDKINRQLAASAATTGATASLPRGTKGPAVKSLPPSLQKYNRTFPSAVYPSAAWTNLFRMPFGKVAELAEWAGAGVVPGVTMAQVSLGEGDLKPGSESTDGGFGMWGYTPSAAGIILGHSGPDAHNPIIDAEIMAAMYRANPAGVPPSSAIWHGIGAVTDSSAHYRGRMMSLGGIVRALAAGTDMFTGQWAMVGEDGPELARFPQGTRVLARQATDNVLDGLANMGGGPPASSGKGAASEMRVVLEDHRTRVLFNGDVVREIVHEELDAEHAHTGQMGRMR